MTFDAPYAFLLLLLIPVLLGVRRVSAGGKKRAAVRFSWTGGAALAGRSWRQRMGFIPLVLRVLALALLVVALARPQKGLEQVRDVNEGIAIEMVIDRSSSMREPMMYEGRRMSRLEVVKEVFQQFVIGDGDELEGRPNDLIGLVTFAGYAEQKIPLILGHGTFPRFVEEVQLARSRAEDGTAIGDAIALAAADLAKAEDEIRKQAPDRADSYELKSKIMILLTDGEQTAGQRSPMQGASLAKEWGIKIYTIAVGGRSGGRRPLGLFAFPGGGVDTRTLQAIADATGGKAFLAQDANGLADIYKEIDELERSKIESLRFVDYKELFFPFALAALLVVAIEVLLSATVFRRIP